VVGADPPTDTTQSGNSVTRTLKRLAPNCINGIFHACWSSPPQKPQPPQTDERKGAKSREVAEFYVEHANYRAAESRFREALQYNPNDAKAVFELAECLEKLKRVDEAIAEYQLCIDEQPPNSYTERARKALQRLEESSKVALPRH
jgi:Tfp pilus assembly protein PilF